MDCLVKCLGYKIKQIRTAKKIKQSELAELVDIDCKYLSRIETGISTPSLNTLFKIVKAIDTDISELFDYTDFKDRSIIIEELYRKIDSFSVEKLSLLMRIVNLLDAKNII